MLLLSVFAAFCAADRTLEKKPPWLLLGVAEPFSGVGVRGADVIFDNLLGPKVADPDLILRCEIIFPDREVMTLGLELVALGSEAPRSRLFTAKRGDPGSVGVGGVFTIIGAGSTDPGGGGGGVRGGGLSVTIGFGLAVRGRSGDDEADPGDDFSGKIEPSLDATLPRLLSAALFSFCNCSAPLPPAWCSELGEVGLVPRFPGRKASFNLRPGDGERF